MKPTTLLTMSAVILAGAAMAAQNPAPAPSAQAPQRPFSGRARVHARRGRPGEPGETLDEVRPRGPQRRERLRNGLGRLQPDLELAARKLPGEPGVATEPIQCGGRNGGEIAGLRVEQEHLLLDADRERRGGGARPRGRKRLDHHAADRARSGPARTP